MTIEIKRSQRTNRSSSRYDYDVYENGVHVATWRPKSWGAKGYVLYGAVGEIVRPLRSDNGLPMVTSSIEADTREQFVEVYERNKKAVPSDGQIRARENRRAAEKEAQRLRALEIEREERIRDAALELYEVVVSVANLNPDAGEIGPGKLAQLVSIARSAQAKAEGK